MDLPIKHGDFMLVHQRVQCHKCRCHQRPISEVTWGHPLYGGDSRSAQTQLVRVQQVHAAETAFAAIRDDGSVVTWGHPEYGGVSAAVQDRLRYLT